MKVSEVPFEDIKVGSRVIGHNGRPGRIIAKFVRTPQESDDNEVEIQWERWGDDPVYTQQYWHFWLEQVTYVGP